MLSKPRFLTIEMKLQSRRQPVQTPPANLPDCRFVLTFRSKISFSSRRELKKSKFWYKRPSKIWHANRIGDLKKCAPNHGFWRSKWKCSPGGNPCKHVLPTSLTVAPRVTCFNIVVQKWASRRGESSKIEISIFKIRLDKVIWPICERKPKSGHRSDTNNQQ